MVLVRVKITLKFKIIFKEMLESFLQLDRSFSRDYCSIIRSMCLTEQWRRKISPFFCYQNFQFYCKQYQKCKILKIRFQNTLIKIISKHLAIYNYALNQ